MTVSKRIGKFPVIREIGQGSMGKVYEGFDPDTGAKVAIKILRAEHLGDEQADSAGARFGREAEIGLRLHHPNIVAVHEYGEQGRIRFIAMEFIEGRELRNLMRERGRFELHDAVHVMMQLLAALDCSHKHGIVHRDIKPSNLMVIEPMRIKTQAVASATDVATMILRIDDVIASGPAPQQQGGMPGMDDA